MIRLLSDAVVTFVVYYLTNFEIAVLMCLVFIMASLAEVTDD